MRFLVTFVCLAVITTVVVAQSADVEPEDMQISAFEVDAAEALLAADSDTGHENESDRVARQYGRRYGYGGRGGYGGGGYGGGGYGYGYGPGRGRVRGGRGRYYG